MNKINNPTTIITCSQQSTCNDCVAHNASCFVVMGLNLLDFDNIFVSIHVYNKMNMITNDPQ